MKIVTFIGIPFSICNDGAAYTTRDPSIGRFFFKCKMGYECHRRSTHGTRVLSPWRKNPGYRDEEGRRETRKEGGGEAAGLSGGVARVSTVDHRGKLAQSQGRRELQRHRSPPPSVPHPPSRCPLRLSVAVARVTRRATPASRYRDQPGVGRGRPCLCCSDGR